MADDKSKIDDDSRLAIATLIIEGRVSIEAASAGLEMLVAREGLSPELIVLGKHLAQAKEALADIDELLRNAAPGADANG